MKTKIILFLTLFFIQFSHQLKPFGSFIHHHKDCYAMSNVLKRGRFTLIHLQSLLKCPFCKSRAFTNLVKYIPNLGHERSLEICDLFIKNDIKINEIDDLGELPLARAADFLSLEAIDLFISIGADINAVDKVGDTALVAAICSSDEATQQESLIVAKRLLEFGANPNIVGSTPPCLNIAAEDGDKDLVFLLLQYGADPNLKDSAGKNFFNYAKENPEILTTYILFKSLSVKNFPKEPMNLIYEYLNDETIYITK